MRKQVGIICEYCGAKVLKDLSEWVRNQNKNRKSFCSGSCAVSYGNKIREFDKDKCISNFKGKNNSSANLDELSPFRPHLKNIKTHSKAKNRLDFVNITLQDLKNQWDKQDGVCPYTGVKLENYKNSQKTSLATPYRASVDRIDSSKGYEVDNIEFISYMAQCAKNRFTKEELIEFCKQVAANHNT